jgi:hypothetical protein
VESPARKNAAGLILACWEFGEGNARAKDADRRTCIEN